MHFARSAVCLFTLTLISGSVFAAGTGIARKSGSVMTSGSTIRAPKANAAPGADVDPARLTPAPKTGAERLTDSSILQRWRAGSIKTHDEAEAALADVDRNRAALKKQEAIEHDACIDRFFVSACWEKNRVNSYDREKEFRRVELEAKDWLRAENAQKEKERQLQAKIEEGKEASAGEIGAVLDDNAPTKRMMGAESRMEARIRAEERVAKAQSDALEKQAKELQNEETYARRQANIVERQAKAVEDAAAAAKRVEQHDKTVERVAERRASDAAKAAKEPENVAAYNKRAADAADRKAKAEQKGADLAQKRAERAARNEQDRQNRIELQKKYEAERKERSESINPFQ